MLIALTGRKGVGKTTIANALADILGARRVRFAGPLKDALMAMGLTRAQVDGAEKETPSALLGGKTPRHAMQTLGTEWGRGMISDSIWVDLAMARVDAELAEGHDVVIDDLRFPNEARAVLERGGVVVEILRDTDTQADEHASEAELPRDLITARAENNGSIAEMLGCFVWPCRACNGKGGCFENGMAHTTYWDPCGECKGTKLIKCSILSS